MLKIIPISGNNVLEVELTDGSVFRIAEFYTGMLTVYVPSYPGSISSVKEPVGSAVSEKEISVWRDTE